MNKITITLIGFLAIVFFSGSAYAGAFANTTAGANCTITGTNSANLVFTPSPGIYIEGATTDTAFTVVAGNFKAGENAIIYCLTNSSPVVYQVAQDLSAVTTSAGMTGNALAAGTSTGFTKRE